MKLSKLAIVISLALFILPNANAYEQKGYVQSISRPGKEGERIAGVSISPKAGQGNPTVSNKNGDFSLAIKGNSFFISKVQRNGYEVMNSDIFSIQHYCSQNPLIIYVVNSIELREENYCVSRQLYDNLLANYKKQQAELEKLRKENKIKEEKYREEIRKLK